MYARVFAVARDAGHHFSKPCVTELRILAGLGVDSDAHRGVTVKHRSRATADPSAPNLRQVHLIHAELFTALAERGYSVASGDLGENITTQGIDLLALPRGTLLCIGESVVLEVTGLRNPCIQIERFRPGLMAAVLEKSPDGTLVRKAGVMTIACVGGWVRPGDPITVTLPEGPHLALGAV